MQESNLLDSHFKSCMGTFATGITVVTAVDKEHNKHGITVNSFNSVSLNPPMVLFSLEKKSSRFDVFSSCSYFVVNILSDVQNNISRLFASKNICNWGDVEDSTITGIPIIKGIIGYFYCQSEYLYEGGDHKIIVAKVIKCEKLNNNDCPLVYYKSHYHKLGGICEY